MRRVLFAVLISITVSACSTVIMPFVVGQRPTDVTNKTIVSNAVAVFQEYGFPPAMVDSDIGIVVTDWAVLTNIESEVTAAIVTETLFGTAETYRERMKLTLTVDETKNTFTIKPMKQQLRTLRGWSAQSLSDTDMQGLEKIANDITARLGAPKGELTWRTPPSHSKKDIQSELSETEVALITAGTIVLIIVLLFRE